MKPSSLALTLFGTTLLILLATGFYSPETQNESPHPNNVNSTGHALSENNHTFDLSLKINLEESPQEILVEAQELAKNESLENDIINKEERNTYENNPAPPLANLSRMVNDINLKNHYNKSRESFLEIWELDLDIEAVESLKEGEIFSLPTTDGENYNIAVDDSKKIVKDTDGRPKKSIFQYTGDAIHEDDDFHFSLTMVKTETEIDIEGTYYTEEGIYRINSPEGDSSVYIMKYSDISESYLLHDVSHRDDTETKLSMEDLGLKGTEWENVDFENLDVDRLNIDPNDLPSTQPQP